MLLKHTVSIILASQDILLSRFHYVYCMISPPKSSLLFNRDILPCSIAFIVVQIHGPSAMTPLSPDTAHLSTWS